MVFSEPFYCPTYMVFGKKKGMDYESFGQLISLYFSKEYKDFVPEKLKGSRGTSMKSRHENFCTVVARARLWLDAQKSVHMVSLQSIEYIVDVTSSELF